MMVVLNPAPPEGAQPIIPDVSPFQEQLELLRDGILRLQDRLDTLECDIKHDIALDRQRIKKLENKGKPQKTDMICGHIDTLASELLTRAKTGQRGVTYAEAAKILGVDKSRICQLRSLIASDSRFDISWHPKKKNTKVICLKNYKSKEIVELNVQ
jgi:hypothetical protein